MKYGWAVLLLLMGLALPHAAQGQASVYAEGTASDLNGGLGNNFLYGGTIGLVYDGPTIFKRVVVSADIQARDVEQNGERLIGVTVGPRFAYQMKKWKLAPYGEFNVGFGRFRAANGQPSFNTTDNLWQAEMGVTKQLTPRFDVVADYDYSQYGANNGEYNPKTFSAGVVFHFEKR
jgi:hypothetical protein